MNKEWEWEYRCWICGGLVFHRSWDGDVKQCECDCFDGVRWTKVPCDDSTLFVFDEVEIREKISDFGV